MKKSFLIYLAASIGIYIFAILICDARLMLFWDFPTLLLTPVVPLLLMLGHYTPMEIIDAFRAAGNGDKSEVEIKKAIVFFRTIDRMIMLSGYLAVVIGTVMVLTTYPSESFNNNIGKYMAICILSMAYALFLVMTICVPFQSALEKKLVR